jgi:hypothetical protein
MQAPMGLSGMQNPMTAIQQYPQIFVAYMQFAQFNFSHGFGFGSRNLFPLFQAIKILRIAPVPFRHHRSSIFKFLHPMCQHFGKTRFERQRSKVRRQIGGSTNSLTSRTESPLTRSPTGRQSLRSSTAEWSDFGQNHTIGQRLTQLYLEWSRSILVQAFVFWLCWFAAYAFLADRPFEDFDRQFDVLQFVSTSDIIHR